MWVYGEEVACDIWTSNIHLNAGATVFLLQDAWNISNFCFLMKSLGFLSLLRAEAAPCRVGLRLSRCWGMHEGLQMATQWPCGQVLALSLLGKATNFTVQKRGALLTPFETWQEIPFSQHEFSATFSGFVFASSKVSDLILQSVHLGQRRSVLPCHSGIWGAFHGLLLTALIQPAAKHAAILSEPLYALCQPLRNQAFLSINLVSLLIPQNLPTKRTACSVQAAARALNFRQSCEAEQSNTFSMNTHWAKNALNPPPLSPFLKNEIINESHLHSYSSELCFREKQ